MRSKFVSIVFGTHLPPPCTRKLATPLPFVGFLISKALPIDKNWYYEPNKPTQEHYYTDKIIYQQSIEKNGMYPTQKYEISGSLANIFTFS